MIGNIARPLPVRSETEVSMNGELSLWRVIFPVSETDRFHAALSNIRSEDNKIRRIDPGHHTHCFDLVITEQELSLLKLSVTGISYSWIQDWIDAKL